MSTLRSLLQYDAGSRLRGDDGAYVWTWQEVVVDGTSTVDDAPYGDLCD